MYFVVAEAERVQHLLDGDLFLENAMEKVFQGIRPFDLIAKLIQKAKSISFVRLILRQRFHMLFQSNKIHAINQQVN
jgi:hypothetical protein